KLLKADERTSHIPVILLTARSSGADKIEGLETGADDFITKPFDAKELQVRIKNLITQREKLSTYYKTKIASAINAENLQLAGQQIASMDEKFLKKALKIVEEHMADDQFGVENFSTEMAFSRMQLHRKLTGLTGQSTSEFIRNIRLNKAAKLLASNSGTVTEIAFQVGFNNLSWFTRCFKEQYGMSPTEFTQE
ncbi:MAG: hybrid sensor histidine kinase/response regulator, partial [Marinilabiliales bacterium]